MRDSERKIAARGAAAGSAALLRNVSGTEPVAPAAFVRSSESRATPDLTVFLPNDHGNACRLIALYGNDLRFCHAYRRWLVWSGRRWAIDTTDQARRLAKHAMLETLNQVVRKGLGQSAEAFARHSLDARRISNLLSMAEPEICITPAEFDRSPHLLNFENGTVDLRTGALGAHRREDWLSKLVPAAFHPQATCLRFERFLRRISGGEGEGGRRLRDYLQKALGYSLTGVTREKAVFIAYGPGTNGKTTLLATFLRLLGDYAALLQIDTLMSRQETNNTQADLADLRGARFVMTSETEQGQRLAEGKLKRITQGLGRIKAVRKYENPIEFEETHKLWLDANHKPAVSGADRAIWNRLRLIPFPVAIPEAQIDRELPAKLMAEAEGILAWAVAGAVRWYREGLGSTPELERERENWRSESEPLARFWRACCVLDRGASAPARALYLAYRSWAEAAGESVLSETAFGRRMTERGFRKDHREQGRVYRGIGVRKQPAALLR